MTESSLIPNVRIAMEVLGSLRRLGVSLLMDDFGTGYSSLNNLHSFPFDVLKIDRSFVTRMTEGDQPLQIVRTIIELARVMGMDVVAEGIETCEQFRLLREMRCRYGQGYLFSRPLTAEAVTTLLAASGPHPARSRGLRTRLRMSFSNPHALRGTRLSGFAVLRWRVPFQDECKTNPDLESAGFPSWEIPQAGSLARGMLHFMQQPFASAPTPASPSFAGLMASLAAPAHKPAGSWEDDLADDIATLSYESALRAHARYRSPAPTDQSLTQAADPGPFFVDGPAQALPAANQQSTPLHTPAMETAALPEQESNSLRNAHLERNLKDASITIRMSKAECAQLHQRAAEAGLTVSAYLRSCTFEAESLRAMVKDTLTQLRSATSQASPAPPRRFWFRAVAKWVARLLTPWHGSPREARA